MEKEEIYTRELAALLACEFRPSRNSGPPLILGPPAAVDEALGSGGVPALPVSRHRMFGGCCVQSLEKAMAPHSSTLAWKVPWTEEPGRLRSVGLLRVGHDCATSLSRFTFMYWRRKWQPTPVFLPGESQGWGSLVGCRLWGRTESDTTEAT